MMELCSSCGESFPLDELIECGFDDDGGEIFALYVCEFCSQPCDDPSEPYIPDGYHVVEDADGERLVKNDDTRLNH